MGRGTGQDFPDSFDLGRRIETALEELSPKERMVFELRHYEGMRLRAIGEIVGISEEAAKNSLFRATRKLRGALGGLGRGEGPGGDIVSPSTVDDVTRTIVSFLRDKQLATP